MQQQIKKFLELNPDKKIHNYAFSMQAIIGRGAYGIVYAGKTIDKGIPVALKAIPLQQMSQETFRLLQKEIEIMKDLDSQNIVKLIDVVRTGNNYYLVSELCTCGDLKEYMLRKGPIDEQTSMNIMIQILRGILQSFKHRVIHRDLKPANILLTEHNSQLLFKIADFGFAKKIDLENDLMTSLAGTPLYMSPQVLLRRQYTSKCDVWSIGLIFYELLEGKLPWNVRDIVDLVNKQRTTRIAFTKNHSQQIMQFIIGCLHYEENKRFSWENVFTNPIFNGIFVPQEKPLKQNPPASNPPTLNQTKVLTPKNEPTAPSPSNLTRVNSNGRVPPSKQPMKTIKPENQGKFVQSGSPNAMQPKKIQYFGAVPQVNFKKDRTISVATKTTALTSQGMSPCEILSHRNSDVKQHYLTNYNGQHRHSVCNGAVQQSQRSQQNKAFTDISCQDFTQNDNLTVGKKKVKHNTTVDCNFVQLNIESIQTHIEYIKVLKQLKDQIRELFSKQFKTNPTVTKLCFILAKHAMIKSNEVKTQLVDKGVNCLDLFEFEAFKEHENFHQYEKLIVETHFETFGQFHQNFLEINEVLNIVMNDKEFSDIFINIFHPTMQFSRVAFSVTNQFIQENMRDIIRESNNQTLVSFSNALLLYCQHMNGYAFTNSEQNRFMQSLKFNNPSFLNSYEMLNTEIVKRVNLQILSTLSNPRELRK